MLLNFFPPVTSSRPPKRVIHLVSLGNDLQRPYGKSRILREKKEKVIFKTLLSAVRGDIFVESQICNPDLVIMCVAQKE